METLRYFTKDHETYKLKPNFGLMIPLGIFFLLLTIWGFFMKNGGAFKWWMLAILILVVFSSFRSGIWIDANNKVLNSKSGLLGGGISLTVPEIQGFTVHKIKSLGLITTNVILFANYTKNGKSKKLQITQGFRSKSIQGVLNELEVLLGNDYSTKG